MKAFVVTETTSLIPIGKQGENNAVSVLFKVSAWQNEYGGGGIFTLSHKRATDETSYPVLTTCTNDGVLWQVSDADNAVAGYGECELRYSVNDVIKKSITWKTKTAEALSPTGDTPPEPYESWYENIISAGDRAEGFEIEAEGYANSARLYSDAAAGYASAAEIAKGLSEQYSAEALGHRNAAETAETAAETAEAAAQAAAESAEADKLAAAASAQAARASELASKSSENAAAASEAAAKASETAAQSASSAAYVSAQNAQSYAQSAFESAQNAANSATAAASSASQAQSHAQSAALSAQNAAASATAAATSETNAAESERQAGNAKEAIENMGATAQTLAPGSDATVTKTVAPGGTVTLKFGIPRGDKGDKGDDYVLNNTDKEEIADMVSGMLVVQVTGTMPTITAEANHRYVCGEVATLDFTPPTSGICDVIFTSGSTATVLTLPSTVKMPDWFDSTALEANTTYEISIADGYGLVASWAV